MPEARLVQAWHSIPSVFNGIVALNSTLRLKSGIAETAAGKNIPVC